MHHTTRRRLGVAVATGALVVSTAGVVGAAEVRPGPALDGWKLVAEGGTGQLDVDAGWVTEDARGSALLAPDPATVIGLQTDNYGGLLSAITSMNVTVKSEGSALNARVVLRTATPCNYAFNIPVSADWATYDLTADINPYWYTVPGQDVVACPEFGIDNWTALKAHLPGARIDEGVLDGIGGFRIQTGATTDTNQWATAYVDSFELNGEVSDFEPPTLSLIGGSPSVAAGGSIEVPVSAVLSGPNQPAFGNFLGPITANGGLTSSAEVNVDSSPAGLCRLIPATPTFAFEPESGLSVRQARVSPPQSVTLATQASGSGGTCTLSLGSPVNATTAGQVTVHVTPTPPLPGTLRDDGYTVTAGGTLTVSAAQGVLDNDDVDGASNPVVSLAHLPQNGIVNLDPEGSFTYRPRSGFVGGDVFQYKVTTPAGTIGEASVSVWVQAGALAGSTYVPLDPARIYSTIDTGTPFGPGESRAVQVTGRGEVPASDVTAVVFNVTAAGGTASSHLIVWPEGQTQPTTSNINFQPGVDIANTAVVKLGAGGQVRVFNLAGTAHVILDVVGYFTSPGSPVTRQPPAAPTTQTPAAPQVQVSLRSVSNGSKLKVNVNPNKGKGYWRFQLQKMRADGTWQHLKTYRTQGAKETRTINRKKGTYRVVALSKYGYQGATSNQVELRR